MEVDHSDFFSKDNLLWGMHQPLGTHHCLQERLDLLGSQPATEHSRGIRAGHGCTGPDFCPEQALSSVSASAWP